MLVLHWLSAQSHSETTKQHSAESEIELLRNNLREAAANASALGAKPALTLEAMSPLLEMLEMVRTELGKIESSTAIIERRTVGRTPKARVRNRQHRKAGEPPAQRIARRLLEQGIPIAEAARKTLLPESVVRNLLRQPESTPAEIRANAPLIERSRLLL